MQKRHLVVGAVMFVASLISYGLVQADGAVASAAFDLVSPAHGLAAAASPLLPTASGDLTATLLTISDSALLLAAGAALFVAAAGLRRQNG